MLTIIVADNGKGLKEGKTSERRSFGLNILRERLMLISNKSSLSIENRVGVTGCHAKI
jgi:signal transduction histidine kinase